MRLLLDKGARVVVGDLNPMPIEHEHLAFAKTNVTVWADLSQLFKLAKSKHGKIDHVFANAGISGKSTYLDERFDDNGDLLEPSHHVMDINLRAVINTSVLAIHYLRRQEGGGSIVLTASASSFQRFRVVDYATAKHGVLGLMRGLTVLLQPKIPIRVNAISPSWTTTGIVPDGLVKHIEGVKQQSPSVVARSVAILMADHERSGQLIYTVDGVYSEAEETLLQAAKAVVGDMNEDLVMAQLLEAGSMLGTRET